eukprot:6193723-Pleurochrysis_carterae.AAC.2
MPSLVLATTYTCVVSIGTVPPLRAASSSSTEIVAISPASTSAGYTSTVARTPSAVHACATRWAPAEKPTSRSRERSMFHREAASGPCSIFIAALTSCKGAGHGCCGTSL